MRTKKSEVCPDCSVTPGDQHLDNCDVSRCTECGNQRISCGCRKGRYDIWTGEWPGVAECREYGWYAVLNPFGAGWVECEKDFPGARENLNRLHAGNCKWNKNLQKWVKKSENKKK